MADELKNKIQNTVIDMTGTTRGQLRRALQSFSDANRSFISEPRPIRGLADFKPLEIVTETQSVQCPQAPVAEGGGTSGLAGGGSPAGDVVQIYIAAAGIVGPYDIRGTPS